MAALYPGCGPSCRIGGDHDPDPDGAVSTAHVVPRTPAAEAVAEAALELTKALDEHTFMLKANIRSFVEKVKAVTGDTEEQEKVIRDQSFFSHPSSMRAEAFDFFHDQSKGNAARVDESITEPTVEATEVPPPESAADLSQP